MRKENIEGLLGEIKMNNIKKQEDVEEEIENLIEVDGPQD